MAIIPKGQEPERVKKRMETLFAKLDEAYPDKVISSLQKEHKTWAETVTELYRILGYEDNKSFLEAYGYIYERAKGGRSNAFDPKEVIEQLQKKYPQGSEFTKVDELFDANPDIVKNPKTLKNIATKVFGMSIGKYLLSVGLIQPKIASVMVKEEKKKNYIICKVLPTVAKESIYCIATSKSIHVGDTVEVPMGVNNSLAFALVQDVICCDEESAPCDINEVKTINRKIGVREYNAGLLASILRVNAALGTDELIDNAPASIFSPIDNLLVEIEGNIPWACCRGLSTDVMKVLDYLVEKDNQIYEYNDLILIDDGISELYIFGDDVLNIIEKYPDIKMVMFLENAQSGKVHLCYSKSGYSTFTDTYMIGECDTNSKSRWTLKNSPTEDFKEGNIEYTFKFSDDWEGLNYVFTDETGVRKQLGK